MRHTWWLAAVLAATAACGGGQAAPDAALPDSQTPLVIPMQIVVTPGAVAAYMDAVDFGGCGCAAVDFPAPGSCSFMTDANPCNGNPFCKSCITEFRVEVDGEPITPTASGGNDPWVLYFGSFPVGHLSLVLAGCGHPTTRISLDGPAFLQTSATADYVGGTAHVSWTTDQPPLATLLTLDNGFGGELCQVQGVSDYTFTNYTSALDVSVEPFGSRMDVDTDFGAATIWRAGDAEATFP